MVIDVAEARGGQITPDIPQGRFCLQKRVFSLARCETDKLMASRSASATSFCHERVSVHALVAIPATSSATIQNVILRPREELSASPRATRFLKFIVSPSSRLPICN